MAMTASEPASSKARSQCRRRTARWARLGGVGDGNFRYLGSLPASRRFAKPVDLLPSDHNFGHLPCARHRSPSRRGSRSRDEFQVERVTLANARAAVLLHADAQAYPRQCPMSHLAVSAGRPATRPAGDRAEDAPRRGDGLGSRAAAGTVGPEGDGDCSAQSPDMPR